MEENWWEKDTSLSGRFSIKLGVFPQNLCVVFPLSVISNPGKVDWLSFLCHWCFPYIRASSFFFFSLFFSPITEKMNFPFVSITETNEANWAKISRLKFLAALSGNLSKHFSFSLKENRTAYATAPSVDHYQFTVDYVTSKSVQLFFYQILEYWQGFVMNFSVPFPLLSCLSKCSIF